jgi:hypothetical protein
MAWLCRATVVSTLNRVPERGVDAGRRLHGRDARATFKIRKTDHPSLNLSEIDSP